MVLAVTLLDATTFQLTYQLKVLTTALFAVLMLGFVCVYGLPFREATLVYAMDFFGRTDSHSFDSKIILTMGVAFLQLPETSVTKTRTSISHVYVLLIASAENESVFKRFAGLIMVLMACFSSGCERSLPLTYTGFAGIYFEKMLKGETSTVWIMNIQLGFFGSLLALAGMVFNDLPSGSPSPP